MTETTPERRDRQARTKHTCVHTKQPARCRGSKRGEGADTRTQYASHPPTDKASPPVRKGERH
eukprot:1925482-Prorocentrum_lima.AAC.1